MFFEVTFGSLSVPKGILGLILGGTEKRRKKGTEGVSGILGKGGGVPYKPFPPGSWFLGLGYLLGPGSWWSVLVLGKRRLGTGHALR